VPAAHRRYVDQVGLTVTFESRTCTVRLGGTQLKLRRSFRSRMAVKTLRPVAQEAARREEGLTTHDDGCYRADAEEIVSG